MIRQLVQAATIATIAFGAQHVIAGGMAEGGTGAPAANNLATSGNQSASDVISATPIAASTETGTSSTGGSATTGSSTSTSTAAAPATNVLGSTKTSTNRTAAASNNDGQSPPAFVAIEDDPLIVDTSGIMDSDGMGTVQVQWQVSSDGQSWINLTGAAQQSFTPREAHVGQLLRVQISYVDGQGNLETLVSPPSSPVQNVNDKPTGAPQLTGTAREKDTLVVDTSLIADEDGVGKYDIVWQQSSTKSDWQAYPEVNGEVLQLSQKHVGFSYRAIVSYVDRHGTREILATNPSETVINVDDPVEGEVTLSGEALEGKIMSADTSSVSDIDGIASMTIGWESSRDGRSWRAVETAGNSRVPLSQALVGQQLRARVSVVDSFGVETIIFSKPTNAVKNVNNKPAGTIFVRRVGG